MTSLLPAEPALRFGDLEVPPLRDSPLPSSSRAVCTGPAPSGAEALPLPRHGWGAPEALLAWQAALPDLPVEVTARVRPDDPVIPVSVLTTVVLRVGPWAVKVYPSGTDGGHLRRLTDALTGSSSAHLPVCPPVDTALGVVTVSPWLPAARPVTWAETGRLLRAFHSEHAYAHLPRWRPVSRLESQVAELPEEVADVLRAARHALVEALATTESELGRGVIHGDVSPVNVMRTPAGPRLIDLDWAAVGPREYDLAAAARRFRQGEVSRGTYRRFCHAYGHDVRRWPGLPVVDRLAELGGLVFRLWDCRHHGWTTEWLDAEVRAWRRPL